MPRSWPPVCPSRPAPGPRSSGAEGEQLQKRALIQLGSSVQKSEPVQPAPSSKTTGAAGPSGPTSRKPVKPKPPSSRESLVRTGSSVFKSAARLREPNPMDRKANSSKKPHRRSRTRAPSRKSDADAPQARRSPKSSREARARQVERNRAEKRSPADPGNQASKVEANNQPLLLNCQATSARQGEKLAPWGVRRARPPEQWRKATARALREHRHPRLERTTGFEPATLTLAR
jgi:hypothetical protein